MTKYLHFLFLLLCPLAGTQVWAQQNPTDSLERELPLAEGKERVLILIELSWQYGFSDAKKAEKVSAEALKLALELNDSALLGEAYNSAGILTYRQGKFNLSLVMNKKALEIRRHLNDKPGMGSSLSKIGNIENEQANYEESLRCQLEALDIFIEMDNRPYMGMTYNNIANIYASMKNYEKMKEYTLEALHIFEDQQYPYGIAGSLGNLGVYYQRNGLPDSALFYMLQASVLFKESGALMDAANCENNIGVSYRSLGKMEEGLTHYLNAYKLSQEIGDVSGEAHYGANAGGALLSLKRYAEAQRYFLEALAHANENGINRVRRQCYDGLSSVAEATGNYPEALRYQDLVIQVSDSMFNQEQSRQVNEAEARYQNAKKTRDLARESEKRALAELESETRKLQAETQKKWTLSLGGLTLGIFFFGLYIVQRNKRIERGKRDAALIRERESGLKAVIHATEEERKRIAKDLHDGIGQQLGGLKLAWQKLGQSLPNEAQGSKLKELTRILDDTADDVRSLSHQMMPKVLSELGLIPAIEDMLQKSLGNAQISYEFEHFGIETRPDEAVEITLFRISQELSSNIIRHAQANRVSVQLFRNKNHIILIVEDNGRGFDFEGHRAGIGLMNISSRLHTVGGEMNYSPGPVSGTVVTIRIPVA